MQADPISSLRNNQPPAYNPQDPLLLLTRRIALIAAIILLALASFAFLPMPEALILWVTVSILLTAFVYSDSGSHTFHRIIIASRPIFHFHSPVFRSPPASTEWREDSATFRPQRVSQRLAPTYAEVVARTRPPLQQSSSAHAQVSGGHEQLLLRPQRQFQRGSGVHSYAPPPGQYQSPLAPSAPVSAYVIPGQGHEGGLP